MLQPTKDKRETAQTHGDYSTSAQNPEVIIKKERLDPEIEMKLQFVMHNIKKEPPDNSNDSNIEGTYKNRNTQYDTRNENSMVSVVGPQENRLIQKVELDREDNEKKNIEPVKSSNEILTELFQVFNAAPPEELLDDKNLIKNARKHQKEKKKKHKKQKDYSDESLTEDEKVSSGVKHKSKKSKKKHKHKHKDGSATKDKEKDTFKSKVKERSKSKDKNKEKCKIDKRSIERSKSRNRELSKEMGNSNERGRIKDEDKKIVDFLDKYENAKKSNNVRKIHLDKVDSRLRKTDGRDTKNKSLHCDGSSERKNGDHENNKLKIHLRTKKSHRYIQGGQISDISLSDEETYLKEKEINSDNSKRKPYNSFYDSAKRSRSREKDRERERYRYRDRDRDRDRDSTYHNRGLSRHHSRYSRSRSRSRSRDLGIDKKRLLEIARKNVISMFKRGNLPGCDHMSQEVKDKVLLKMRYGNRTVEDLTDFCKKISNGKNLSDLSSDEDSDVDKAGNTKAFHHPFQLKEREPIVMHIRNSKTLLPIVSKTQEQTKAITMQFPVSSGQQHRMTEHWIPVETKDNVAPLPALPAASSSTMIFKNNLLKNALGKPLPLEEQKPAFKPVLIPSQNSEATTEIPAASTLTDVAPSTSPTSTHVPVPVATALPPLPNPVSQISTTTVNILNPTPVAIVAPQQPTNFLPDVGVPSSNSSIFSQMDCSTLDVSSIISKRLNAMRRLQENPMDSEAIKMMYNSQKEMTSWASSKHLPGQFTGSTGVNVLKPNQLNSGPQVWARKNQLTSLKPVTGGMGMHLLQKMGWKPGEGLGREKNGSLQPLLLDVKLDKRGLIAQEDCHRKGMAIKRKSAANNTQLAQQNLEEKHPVCLLNELTSKRKWTPPMYNLVNENGPSHSKMFLFSVQVNGQTFTPNKAYNTKKEAKMVAAKYCLQQIGILPDC